MSEQELKKLVQVAKTTEKSAQLIAANKAAAASILLSIRLQLSQSCSHVSSNRK